MKLISSFFLFATANLVVNLACTFPVAADLAPRQVLQLSTSPSHPHLNQSDRSQYIRYLSPHPIQFSQKDFQTTDPQFKKADELLEAAFYTKAIAAYSEILQQIETEPELHLQQDLDLAMLARFRLAYVYFLLEQYQESIHLLKENTGQKTLSSKQETIRRHSLFLLAHALKQAHQDMAAKEAFIAYRELSAPPDLPFSLDAFLEVGYLDFLHHRDEEAAKIFTVLSRQTEHPHVSTLASFYLAKLAIRQGDPSAAIQLLQPLLALAPDNPLLFEVNRTLGEAAFRLGNNAEAVAYLKTSLPADSDAKADTLYYLGWSYLRMAEEAEDPIRQQMLLLEAETAFTELSELIPNEQSALALAQCLISQARRFKKPELYEKAENLLANPMLFSSQEGRAQALLFRAEAASTYILRDQFYRQLIAAPNDTGILYAEGWFMYALNDFEHGQSLLTSNSSNAAQNAFERAAKAFKKAAELLAQQNLQQAGEALKYQALATSYAKTESANQEASEIMDELLNRSPFILAQMNNHDELYYLYGHFASKLAQENENYLKIAQHAFQKAASHPDSHFGDKALYELASLYYDLKKYQEAEEGYLQLTRQYPLSSFAAEAWLWAAYAADALHRDPDVGKIRRQYAFEHFPQSPYAAEAYFTYYTYPEYTQGDRAAIKHLKAFVTTYVDSPFLMDANFLIGLDAKRDRKTPEGKWLSKKSLMDAIDAFQKVEILFDDLIDKGSISSEQLDYYIAMRYRATLERALANLGIANEAQGAKRKIYLDYAEEVLKNLQTELKQRKSPYVKRLFQDNPHPLIEEETSFWLAQTYIKAKEDEAAGRVLAESVDRYQQSGVTKGYYLARTYDEQGKLAMRQEDFPKALHLFQQAKEAAKGGGLSTDHKLDLWIRESQCYRDMKQYDEAILILSKVINDDAISSLRMKAMYLRAELYELQKRPELARKQLESMVKKGGIWAKKAQEKLDKDFYGH